MTEPRRATDERAHAARRSVAGLALAVACWSAGCDRDVAGRTVETLEPWFEDIAASSGIDFRHVSSLTQRYHFPEIMSGGVGLFDYDGDGDLDVYLVQGGDLVDTSSELPVSKLFQNRGGGHFDDVTDRSRVGNRGYGMGCACGDYDADGDVDLFVTNVGPDVLYRNDGDGTFTDVTREAGVGDPKWGSSAAFLDYDRDGMLDLFVVNYIDWSPEKEILCGHDAQRRDYCHPNSYAAPARPTLYRGLGQGKFADVTQEAGLAGASGNGLGIAWDDFDGDGRIDLYVANDMQENDLWLGVEGGRFENRAFPKGCAVDATGAVEAGMGVVAVDADQDGDPDLFVTNLDGQSNTFYENQRGVFTDVTAMLGLGLPSLTSTGFGVGFADFDNDGWLDVYIANGRVRKLRASVDPNDLYAEPNLLFAGTPSRRYEEVPNAGTRTPLIETSRAAAFGDLDDDGGIDIVVVNRDDVPNVLRNVAHSKGRWVAFKVLDRNRTDALGARVEITACGRLQRRTVHTAFSYCASNDPRVHFGLGDCERIEALAVTWPDGAREPFDPVPVNAIHVLRRDAAR